MGATLGSRISAGVLAEKKKLREYQKKAIDEVVRGFETSDRGRLIMACGTGKTFTSLKMAERLAGAGGCVLYLVPTFRSWRRPSRSGRPIRRFRSRR